MGVIVVSDGTLFKKFRNFIMNVDPTTNRSLDQRSVLRNEQTEKGKIGAMTDVSALTTGSTGSLKDTGLWTQVEHK